MSPRVDFEALAQSPFRPAEAPALQAWRLIQYDPHKGEDIRHLQGGKSKMPPTPGGRSKMLMMGEGRARKDSPTGGRTDNSDKGLRRVWHQEPGQASARIVRENERRERMNWGWWCAVSDPVCHSPSISRLVLWSLPHAAAPDIASASACATVNTLGLQSLGSGSCIAFRPRLPPESSMPLRRGSLPRTTRMQAEF